MWLERKAEDSETNVENETPRPSVNTGQRREMTVSEHMHEDGSVNTCAGGSSARRHLHKSKEIFQKGKNLQRWDRQERR